ncbi:MAG: FGGY family carbohydrate kinase, partial [Bacteroidota bacterium]
VDKDQQVLRPSIIWCDSRAVEIGKQAFTSIGVGKTLVNLLKSPGNFTASKLKWVKENQPDIYEKIHKIMLPGDFIAMKLSGDIRTTVSGLSEGIFWNFKENALAQMLLDHYGIDASLIPETVDTFSRQGELSAKAADLLGLKAGIPITYRAGDQPNNAMSLNVLRPGEIAATAGTSGVVYGVSDTVRYDSQSRVNTFAHVNHGDETRLGVLLCINGTGILNSWMKHNLASHLTYEQMNQEAEEIPIGSEGVIILPFGNGAERVLCNENPGSQFFGIEFNRHRRGHLIRAAQEGIVFSFKYGMDIMREMGINPSVIRAGKANMFLSPIFRETLAGITQTPIELYNTDGAQGAARAAGIGAGHYSSFEEAFEDLSLLEECNPDPAKSDAFQEAYGKWLEALKQHSSAVE